jgi:hypothetical protein
MNGVTLKKISRFIGKKNVKLGSEKGPRAVSVLYLYL